MAEPSTIELLQMQEGMTDQQRMLFVTQYNAERKDRIVALVLSIILGTFGVDRFYIGDIKYGIIKLLTLGALGIWYLADWFMIMGAADKKNFAKAREIFFAIKPK